MTWEQYWYGDVWMVEAYRQADKQRLERENMMLWLQGLYNYEALCDASPIFRDFAKNGTKPVPYRTEPYPLGKKKDVPTEQEVKNERLKATLFFKNWARAAEKKFR
jgi:hypothetical protein|nr:MAG TPA: hypothetical protein [Caudoviricetes sp.]